MKNKNLIVELWDFLKVRKRWWLAPIIITLILMGTLFFIVNSTPATPFIYALF